MRALRKTCTKVRSFLPTTALHCHFYCFYIEEGIASIERRINTSCGSGAFLKIHGNPMIVFSVYT